MLLEVDGRKAFAYTAAHEVDPGKLTVVFLHGAGLDHSWFGLQSRYFGYHGCNTLALDFPGHGRSDGPALASVEHLADWVMRVLDATRIRRASLVGHSMGSLIALEAAVLGTGHDRSGDQPTTGVVPAHRKVSVACTVSSCGQSWVGVNRSRNAASNCSAAARVRKGP